MANSDPTTLTYVHAPTSQGWGGTWNFIRKPSTSSEIITAVNSTPNAATLITGVNAYGNDGSGSVTAMIKT